MHSWKPLPRIPAPFYRRHLGVIVDLIRRGAPRAYVTAATLDLVVGALCANQRLGEPVVTAARPPRGSDGPG